MRASCGRVKGQWGGVFTEVGKVKVVFSLFNVWFSQAVLGNWRAGGWGLQRGNSWKNRSNFFAVVAATQWAFPFWALPDIWTQTARTRNMLRFLPGTGSQLPPHYGLLCKQAVWKELSLNLKVGSKMLLFIFGVEFCGSTCSEFAPPSRLPLEHG